MKKVLVVDDTEHYLVRCSIPLERAGYETIKAKTPEEAIAVYITDRPDAVVSDYRFETVRDERGLWIGSEIRRIEAERSLQRRFMVLMSQSYVPESKWKPAGFDAYFDKMYFEHQSERLIKLLQGAGI